MWLITPVLSYNNSLDKKQVKVTRPFYMQSLKNKESIQTLQYGPTYVTYNFCSIMQQ